jgi:threonyl-tRNA synthetase
VRARGGKDLGVMSLDAFVQLIKSDIADKSLV